MFTSVLYYWEKCGEIDYLKRQGISQLTAANIVSLSWLGYAIACPLLGVISDITKRRKPTLILCGLLGLLSTISIIYIPITAHWIYGACFFLLGFAASGQNIGFVTIAEHVEIAAHATALGIKQCNDNLIRGIHSLTHWVCYSLIGQAS